MAKKKLNNKSLKMKLNKKDFDSLTQLASGELMAARLKYADAYRSALAESNNPADAVEKANKKSPISISYNYTVTESFEDKESGETWTEISVSDEKEAKKIESMFDVVKEEEQVAEPEPESDTSNQKEEQQTEEK